MNVTGSILSIVGLVFDFTGMIILFKYGLPSNHSPGIRVLFDESKENEALRIKKNREIEIGSKIGLMTTIIGFGLQLIGSILIQGG